MSVHSNNDLMASGFQSHFARNCLSTTRKIKQYTSRKHELHYVRTNRCGLASKNLLSTASVRHGQMGASSRAAANMEEYWRKNRQMERPLSPHLSIYKLPVTAKLSITNRITGSILTAVMYVGPIVYLIGAKDFGGYLEMVKSWGTTGTALVQVTKFGLAFSFSYHFLSGIRHLAWDMAKGFQMSQVHASGYTLMALTVLVTAVLMYI